MKTLLISNFFKLFCLVFQNLRPRIQDPDSDPNKIIWIHNTISRGCQSLCNVYSNALFLDNSYVQYTVLLCLQYYTVNI